MRDWSRAWMVPGAALLALVMFVASGIDMFDPHFYVDAFAEGIPGWTAGWPYPPLAMAPASVARLTPEDPNQVLVLLVTVPATLVTLAMLWLTRGPFRVRSLLFTMAAASLLAVSYANRLEPLSVTLAVAGLLALRASRTWLAGVLLGLGGLVKAWPLALVAAATTWRRWHVIASTIALWAIVWAAALVLGARDFWSWLGVASSRGIEGETLAALAGLWARVLGVPGYDVYLDGLTASAVIDGPGLSVLRWTIVAVTLGVVIAVTIRRRQALARDQWTSTHAAHALLMVLALLLCLPVLSPQFICWPLAVIAVALVDGWLRGTAVAWLAVCALTTIVFPLNFVALMYEGSLMPLVVLTARNLVIVAIFGVTAARLWGQPKTAA